MMLKSPICVMLGAVDDGKTSLLDKLRGTNVQGHEVAGITQQIGATMFTQDKLIDLANSLLDNKIKVPGLLILDTPGHSAFANMRITGTNICNMAIVVINIMNGIKQQTIECINLLKQTNTPYIVAVNKLDLIYSWETHTLVMKDNIKLQKQDTISHFEKQINKIILEFAENGLNAELYYKNKAPKNYSSLIPCSAKTREGIPDLVMLLVGLIQKFMVKQITWTTDIILYCMEVKRVQGHGVVLDCILSNGEIKVDDHVLLSCITGPRRTYIKRLYVPKSEHDIRIKCDLTSVTNVIASSVVRICVDIDVDDILSGSCIKCITGLSEEAIEDLELKLISNLTKIHDYKNDIGVRIHAPSLGSLEACMLLLEQENIPIASMSIGQINKKDIMKHLPMLEKNIKYAVILAFDVGTTDQTHKFAEENNIKIIHEMTCYRLIDKFKDYVKDVERHELEQKKKELRQYLILPCKLKVIPQCIFRKSDPIILGVTVINGILRSGTKLCVKRDNEIVVIGTVTSIENNKKTVNDVKRDTDVCIKIMTENSRIEYDKTFTANDYITTVLDDKNIEALSIFAEDYGLDNSKLKDILM